MGAENILVVDLQYGIQLVADTTESMLGFNHGLTMGNHDEI